MNLRRLINLALAVFVTVGLAAAPLTGPGALAQGKAFGMAEMSMDTDMQCCPDQKSMDCQDCPLIAMCMLQTAQAGPSMAAALPLRYPIRTSHIVRDDTLAAGLDRPPPDHPPRTLT